ncbi:hypothetical protein PENSPDRAFT_671630 [Peniophora sp. CONT]|nr:hypothetical protein PENSPDRAFT_671630 [Peniophora sp. CONT]
MERVNGAHISPFIVPHIPSEMDYSTISLSIDVHYLGLYNLAVELLPVYFDFCDMLQSPSTRSTVSHNKVLANRLLATHKFYHGPVKLNGHLTFKKTVLERFAHAIILEFIKRAWFTRNETPNTAVGQPSVPLTAQHLNTEGWGMISHEALALTFTIFDIALRTQYLGEIRRKPASITASQGYVKQYEMYLRELHVHEAMSAQLDVLPAFSTVHRKWFLQAAQSADPDGAVLVI